MDQALNAAVIGEIVPVVHILEDVVHRDGDLAPRFAHHAWVIVLSPPVVDDGLEEVLISADLLEPSLRVLVIAVDVGNVLVRQDDVENRNDEQEGANEGLSLQVLDREVGHHAHLERNNDEEGGICGGFDETSLRVDFFTVHVEQVQAVNDVAYDAKEGC